MATASEEPEVPVGKQQCRAAKLCGILLEDKVRVAVTYMSKSSIYGPSDAVINELSSGQCLLLGLLYGLAEGDTEMAGFLIRLSLSLQSIKYTYMKDWLTDDYDFDRDYIAKAMSRLAVISENGVFQLNQYLMIAISGLPEKYGLVNFYFFKGDFTALGFVYFLANITRDGFRLQLWRNRR